MPPFGIISIREAAKFARVSKNTAQAAIQRLEQANTTNAALKAAIPWLLLLPEQQVALAGIPDEEKRILAIKQLELEAHKTNQRPKQAILNSP